MSDEIPTNYRLVDPSWAPKQKLFALTPPPETTLQRINRLIKEEFVYRPR